MASVDSALAVSVRGLSVRYGDIYGVRDVDLDLPRGEILGIIGPNGAGKTSLVECMEGLRPRSAGEVDVLGLDPARSRKSLVSEIGVQLQDTSYPTRARVSELCALFTSFYPDARSTDELLDQFDLRDKTRAYVTDLSGGQRQKLSLVLALVGRPKLLFLDELTTGLDPAARRSTWDLLRSLNQAGTSIILTSHFMDEIEALCDSVLLLDRGRTRLVGTVNDFVAECQDSHSYTIEVDGSGSPSTHNLEALAGVSSVSRQGRRIVVRGTHPQAYDSLVDALGRHETVRHRPPDLEEAFLHLTGRQSEESDNAS